MLKSEISTTYVTRNVNTPPYADAGADITAYTGDRVTLDGSGSYDIDGDQLTYAWAVASKPKGSSAYISGSSAVNPQMYIDLPGA